MEKLYYDLHIHSALSPCADNDMTPNDIVGMALLNKLDIIAITDHNSFANTEAVIKAAHGKEIIVLPGAEISTAEEVHVVCLFCEIDTALNFEQELSAYYAELANRIDIFGNQTIFDEHDQAVGELARMLIAPTSISFDELYELVHKYGGAFIPAHVDRESFSVMANLGFIPPHLEISTIEISTHGLETGYDKNNAEQFERHLIISSSDAHQLWVINERKNFMLLPERSAKSAIEYLR